MNALHRAILAGRPAEVLYLLERRNYDPNIRDENLRTPLIACSLADKEDTAGVCAAVLLNKGAKISLSDRLGKNALCWACLKEKVTLVKMFLENYPQQFQFDLRKKDRDGNTALHFAARAGNPAIVALLLRTYADNNLYAEISDRNSRGETPLHLAAKRGNSGAILALLPVSSDALFGRRGAVDFRSAPKWANAAMKVSKSTGDFGANYSNSLATQHLPGSARTSTLTVRKKRPNTVTAVPSDFARLPCTGHIAPSSKSRREISKSPCLTNISEIFKISEVQCTARSAYRHPARAPPQPTAPPVGDYDKNSRRRSSLFKLPGKGRRGSLKTTRSRSSSRLESEGETTDKLQPKQCKTVPALVIDEAADAHSNAAPWTGPGRPLVPSGREDSAPVKSTKRSPSYNRSMSDIPESPVQSGTFLTPFDGPGMISFSNRASSLQSLASDLPGLIVHKTALDNTDTAHAVIPDSNQAPQIRRTRSEPSLNTLEENMAPPLAVKNNGSRVESRRSRGSTNRRRGQAKHRVTDRDKNGSVDNGKRQSLGKLTQIKLETPNHVAPHVNQSGELPAPFTLASPPSSSRSGRRFFRSSREAELTMQRRRTELERKIRVIQTDLEKLEKRRQGRKYRSLIPEWVTVDEETTLEEVMAAVLTDQSDIKAMEKLRQQKRSAEANGEIDEATVVTLNDIRDLGRSLSDSTDPFVDSDYDLEQEGHPSCASSLDLDAQIQSELGRPQRPMGIQCQGTDLKSPRPLQNYLRSLGPTLQIPRPAHAPVYKQSRSIFSHPSAHHHQLPTRDLAAHLLPNNNRDSYLQSRVASAMRNSGPDLRYKPAKPGSVLLNHRELHQYFNNPLSRGATRSKSPVGGSGRLTTDGQISK